MTQKALLPVSKIVPDENQPRKYFDAKKMAILRMSIKRDGVLTPLIVEPMKGKDGKYRLIDGERRFRAAVEEGLKEVPYVILETADESDRLMQQFQIQEMHENWTPTEKALALEKLAEEMSISLIAVCKMLGFPKDTTRKYVAFSTMIDKNAYARSEAPFEWAAYIQSLKNVVKRIYNDVLQKPFERQDAKDVESSVLKRIKDGSIRNPGDIVKIKDAIIKNPKFIEKFIETNISPEAMFYESKAQGAYHLRNAVLHAGYIQSHIAKFLAAADVKPTDKDITFLKGAYKILGEAIDKVSD